MRLRKLRDGGGTKGKACSWTNGTKRRQPFRQIKIHNPELHRLYQKVDPLPDEDQKARLVVLDSLVKRSRILRVMTE